MYKEKLKKKNDKIPDEKKMNKAKENKLTVVIKRVWELEIYVYRRKEQNELTGYFVLQIC